jgi:putative oxidoreductase
MRSIGHGLILDGGGFMSYVVVIGRILFAAIFLVAAPRHFTGEGAAHAAALGVPLARLAVPLSGVLALAGGLSVLLGYYTRAGAWALIAFLVPVTFMMHAFWRLEDPLAIHLQQAMFMKNLSMVGAALLIVYFGGGPLSLDARMGR